MAGFEGFVCRGLVDGGGTWESTRVLSTFPYDPHSLLPVCVGENGDFEDVIVDFAAFLKTLIEYPSSKSCPLRPRCRIPRWVDKLYLWGCHGCGHNSVTDAGTDSGLREVFVYSRLRISEQP